MYLFAFCLVCQRDGNWQRSALDERLLAARSIHASHPMQSSVFAQICIIRTFGASKLLSKSSSSDSEDDAAQPTASDFGYKQQHKKKKKKKKKDKNKTKSDKKKDKKHKKQKKQKKLKKEKKHKKSKKDQSDSSSSDDESVANAVTAPAPKARMDWMMAVPQR